MELLKSWPLLLLAVLLLLLRVWHVLIPLRLKVPLSSYSRSSVHYTASTRKNPIREVRVMAVLGSGGHTTELLKLMKRLDRDVYTYISFVLAETDKTSQKRTQLDYDVREATDSFDIIPRSREVGQSWSSSVWTTLLALYSCLRLVYNRRPQLVLCNGPGAFKWVTSKWPKTTE
uniref:UDP-N-acetylglucosamine transferase subunit ALG14 n=1 Tax=Hyaloperonospora arabidopsidis (strain Emoy2) TaxID=559515 RepID=M4B8Y0_HYAAE